MCESVLASSGTSFVSAAELLLDSYVEVSAFEPDRYVRSLARLTRLDAEDSIALYAWR